MSTMALDGEAKGDKPRSETGSKPPIGTTN